MKNSGLVYSIESLLQTGISRAHQPGMLCDIGGIARQTCCIHSFPWIGAMVVQFSMHYRVPVFRVPPFNIPKISIKIVSSVEDEGEVV